MPPSNIQKQYLSNSIRDALAKDIQAGKWHSTLPGIKKLMQVYGVSEPPMQQALALLEHEGVIAPSQLGKARQILQMAAQSEHRLLLCRGRRSQMRPAQVRLLDQVSQLLGENKPQVTELIYEPRQRSKFLKELNSHLGSSTRTSVILYSETVATKAIIRKIEPSIPVLCIGGGGGADRLPNVSRMGIDLLGVVADLTQMMQNHSIVRFSLVGWGWTERQHDKLTETIRAKLNASGSDYDPDMHCPAWSKKNATRKLSELLAKHKPQVIIAVDAATWSRLVFELQQMRSNTPVLCLIDDPCFHEFENPPVVGSVNYQRALSKIDQWVQSCQRGDTPHFDFPLPLKISWKLKD